MYNTKVTQKSRNSNPRDWALFVLAIIFFQLLVDVTIILDVPVARQVLCFIYLSLVPGLVLLRIFGMKGLDSVEKLLFSIGLSVVFVIFLGLTVNQIGLSFGFSAILSTSTLLLATNSTVFFICVLCYFLNKNVHWDSKKLNFSLSSVLTVGFPLLAILGTTLVNFSGNSVILLLLIGIIALTVLVSSVRARTNWPLILFMISIAVLFQTSLISNYIVGYDIHATYHVFKITQGSGMWNSVITETDPITPRTNQMLSATIFPVIYSNMLNLDGTWILKTVYPLIFALVPLGLYQLYQKDVGKKVAFVAAFFILADITFVGAMPGLPTQMIAEFFLVLSLLVLFHQRLSSFKKLIFFTIFSAGMIVSHYGISYVFMFLILFAWLFSFLKKIQPKVTITCVTLFCVMAFSWYIYTSQSASFTSLVDMGENIYRNLWTELLNPQSRTEETLRGVGMGEQAASIGHWLGRGFHYATQSFIVLGLAGAILKWKIGFKFHREYIAMSLVMLAFTLLPLMTPSFDLFHITRMYHLSLLVLAPFCIIGGNLFFSVLPKLRKSHVPPILTLIVVTSLFLFETSFIYEVTGDVSYSVPLSIHRMDRAVFYGNGYITECVDVAGAEWLHSNIVLTANTLMYADIVSINMHLTSYAVFPRDHTEILSNVTSFNTNAYVYLRHFNTFDGKMVRRGGYVWNTSDIRSRFESLDKIYTNGGCEISFALNRTGP